jgi:cytochrome c553
MRSTLAVVALLTLGLGVAHAAGDPQAGQRKSAPCQACHGADGNGTAPQFPRLAGQYPDYLVRALQEYKNGNRKNPIMVPFASQLSVQDMEDIAAYFSALPDGVVYKPIGF